MHITVYAKPNKKVEKVEQRNENEYAVFIKARPEHGKANKAIQKLLANYFLVPRSSVVIVSGLSSRKKCIAVLK